MGSIRNVKLRSPIAMQLPGIHNMTSGSPVFTMPHANENRSKKFPRKSENELRGNYFFKISIKKQKKPGGYRKILRLSYNKI